MGGLYKDNIIQPRATKPWRIDTDPASFGSAGDIASFSTLTDMSKWKIGDTPAAAANKLQWHKVQEGNKLLFICDRNILVNVSWDTLNAAGYVTGKTIYIDGQPYLCRLLKGADRQRNGDTSSGGSYDGGYLPNEWDSYITNEGGVIAGIPTPTASDLDGSLVAADRTGTHNQFWNWAGCYSWCQETTAYSSSFRVLLGYYSARHWSYNTSSYVYPFYGWRPVLEQLNSAPVVSGSDSNLGGKSAAFSITYSVTDADNDTVNVQEYVDAAKIKDYSVTLGATNTLTIAPSVWNTLGLGTHTLRIVANDGKGNAVTRTYTFQKTDTLIKFASHAVETEIAAKRITVSGVFTVPPGAVLEISAANNGFDVTPTWEDVTASVLSNDAHIFTNKAKTATKWGVTVRVQIVKNTATSEINCKGFGFTFD